MSKVMRPTQPGIKPRPDAYRSVNSRRPGSAPVVGKRVGRTNEAKVMRNEENKYPVHVAFQKVRPKGGDDSIPKQNRSFNTKKLSDISNKSKPLRSASEQKPRPKPIKQKQIKSSKRAIHNLDPSSIIIEEEGVLSSADEKPVLGNLKKVTKLDVEDAVSLVSFEDSPGEFQGKIGKIVKKSMHRHRDQNLVAEINKQQKEEAGRRKKEQLADLDEKVRKANSRGRSRRTEHKTAWGADQHRLLNKEKDKKLQQEANEERTKRRQERARVKSAGRSRIGMDYVEKLQGELVEKSNRSSSVPPHAKLQQQRKPIRQPKVQIQEFMKQQNRERKQKEQAAKALETSQMQAKQEKVAILEAKKRNQLQRFKERQRKKKSRQRSVRKQRRSQYILDDTPVHEFIQHSGEESDEVRKILDRKSGGHRFLEDDVGLDEIMRDSYTPSSGPELPIQETLSGKLDLGDSDDSGENDQIAQRKEDLRQKLYSLRERVNKVKENVKEEPEITEKRKHAAATKIQALVRGFLTRIWLDKVLEDEEELLYAIVTIQCAVRGYLVRKCIVEEDDSFESDEEGFLDLPAGMPLSDHSRGPVSDEIRARPGLEIEIPDDDEGEMDALVALQCAFRGYLVRRCIVEESSDSDGLSDLPIGIPLSDEGRNEIVFDPNVRERFRKIMDDQTDTDSDIFIDPMHLSDRRDDRREGMAVDDPLSGLIGVDPRTEMTEIEEDGAKIEFPLRIEEGDFSGDSSYLGIGTYTGTGPLIDQETPIISQNLDKNLLNEIAELQEAKKREIELEKLLDESKIYLEEQRKSALQQTLYAQQNFIEDLKKSKQQDAKKFHSLLTQLFGDSNVASEEISANVMSMLDERYAHLANKFCENRKQIEAALGELTEEFGQFTATLPPAEESILTTLISNIDDRDPEIEAIREKQRQYEERSRSQLKFQDKNEKLDRMLDEIQDMSVTQEVEKQLYAERSQIRAQIKDLVEESIRSITPAQKCETPEFYEDTFGADTFGAGDISGKILSEEKPKPIPTDVIKIDELNPFKSESSSGDESPVVEPQISAPPHSPEPSDVYASESFEEYESSYQNQKTPTPELHVMDDEGTSPLAVEIQTSIESKNSDEMALEDIAETIFEELLGELDDVISGKLAVPKRPAVPPIPIPIPEAGAHPDTKETTSQEPSIKTDISSIKAYAEEIFASVKPEEIESALNRRPSQAPLDVLCKLQEVDLVSSEDFESLPSVLDVRSYLTLERLRKDVSSREGMSPNTVKFVSEAENIHNKMIFDAVNECLNEFRIEQTSIINQMPWSSKPVTHHKRKYSDLVAETIQNIDEWSSIESGTIPQGDLVFSNGIVDEESLQLVREEKLATMLAQDVMTMEEQWVDYEMEETQVKIDLSDIILDSLVSEVIDIYEENN